MHAAAGHGLAVCPEPGDVRRMAIRVGKLPPVRAEQHLTVPFEVAQLAHGERLGKRDQHALVRLEAGDRYAVAVRRGADRQHDLRGPDRAGPRDFHAVRDNLCLAMELAGLAANANPVARPHVDLRFVAIVDEHTVGSAWVAVPGVLDEKAAEVPGLVIVTLLEVARHDALDRDDLTGDRAFLSGSLHVRYRGYAGRKCGGRTAAVTGRKDGREEQEGHSHGGILSRSVRPHAMSKSSTSARFVALIASAGSSAVTSASPASRTSSPAAIVPLTTCRKPRRLAPNSYTISAS